MTDEELISYYNEHVYLVNSEFEFIKIKEMRSGIRSNIITIKHKLCGREIDISYGNFTQRDYCKFCVGHRYDTDAFIERFNKREDSTEYTILSQYTNMEATIEVKHNVCGRIFTARADSLIYRNSKCPCVFGKYSNNHTYKMLEDRIIEIDPEYRLIYDDPTESVKILNDHITIEHITCGTKFICIPHNFLSPSIHKRCPLCVIPNIHMISCKDSKGVLIIKQWLEDKCLYYEREKTFDDLRSPETLRKLRFDFYVPDLNLAIEFDGKQHYDTRESSLFTKEKYERIRLYDKMKNKYCERKNINLIRIKYTDSTEKYIYKKLNKFFNKGVYVYIMKHY